MGIAVRDAPTGNQTTRLDQFFDHGGVGFALFPFVVKNVQTGKEWNMVQKLRGFAHVVGHPIHPVAFDKDVIVIGTVAGCSMHKPCARVIGDMIAIDHGHVIGPEIIHIRQWVAANGIGQLIGRDIRHAGVFGDA